MCVANHFAESGNRKNEIWAGYRLLADNSQKCDMTVVSTFPTEAPTQLSQMSEREKTFSCRDKVHHCWLAP